MTQHPLGHAECHQCGKQIGPAHESPGHLLLATAHTRMYALLAEMTVPNKMAYALRHGFDFSSTIHDEPFSCWDRVRLWHRLLKQCHWLMFMGADTMITNPGINAMDMCGPFDFIVAEDVNGINNDVFFMRPCPQSFMLLENILDHRGYYENEQQALADMLTKTEGLRSKICPQKLFNAYQYENYPSYKFPQGQWEPGDFIVHWPGLPLQKRIDLAEKMAMSISSSSNEAAKMDMPPTKH